jgi:hypothetical protein
MVTEDYGSRRYEIPHKGRDNRRVKEDACGYGRISAD